MGRFLGSGNLYGGGDGVFASALGHALRSNDALPLTSLANPDDGLQSVPVTETIPRCVFLGRVVWPLPRDHQPSFEVSTPPLFGDWPGSNQRAPHDPGRIGPSPHSVLVAKGWLILLDSPLPSFYLVARPRVLLLLGSRLLHCCCIFLFQFEFSEAIHIYPHTLPTCHVFLIETEDCDHGHARGSGRPFSLCNIPDQRFPIRLDGLSVVDTHRILRTTFSGTSISTSRVPVTKTHRLPSTGRLRYSSPADSYI